MKTKKKVPQLYLEIAITLCWTIIMILWLPSKWWIPLAIWAGFYLLITFGYFIITIWRFKLKKKFKGWYLKQPKQPKPPTPEYPKGGK